MMNLLHEVEGKMPRDKEKILAIIDRFQSLSQEERDNYKLGRRLGLYNKLDELNDAYRHGEVEKILERIVRDSETTLDEVLFNLMERYV